MIDMPDPADPSNPTTQEMFAILDTMAKRAKIPLDSTPVLLGTALDWALPLLRAMHESPSEPGVTKAWTPQDHFRTLAKMAGECATPASPPSEALKWIMPFVKALAFPQNPHVSAHVGAIERMLTSKPIKEDDQKGALEWALPILRAYAIRKVTTPPTKNTPESNIHNLRLLATGESVAWDLVETALGWALPILEKMITTHTWGGLEKSLAFMQEYSYRPGHSDEDARELQWVATVLESTPFYMSESRRVREIALDSTKAIYTDALRREKEKSDAIRTSSAAAQESPPGEHLRLATDLDLAADDLAGNQIPSPVAMSRIRMRMREAASMLRAPAPSNSRFSAEERKETAWFIRSREIHPNTPDYEAAMYGRAADMISESATTPSPDQESEALEQFSLELLAKRDDPKCPEAVLRSALLDAAMVIRSAGITTKERARLEKFIEEKFPGELDGLPPVTVAIRLLTPQRLPALDAAQIPVTRDLALEVLRGFLASMQRAYPYAPSPSPEQWATAREALIFALADEAQREKAWKELGEIRDLFLAIPGETTLEAARRVLETLKQAQKDLDSIRAMMPPQGQESLVETVATFSRYLTMVMAILGYSNTLPRIEDLNSAIEEKWFKKCRPGTMNMTPNRCDACTAPCGTVHLPVDGIWVFHNEVTDQRDASWKELREIRKEIGANPEKSTLDEVKRLLAKNPNQATLTVLEAHGWAYMTLRSIEDANEWDDPATQKVKLLLAAIQAAWDHRRPE